MEKYNVKWEKTLYQEMLSGDSSIFAMCVWWNSMKEVCADFVP
jgi:hypothetical protein